MLTFEVLCTLLRDHPIPEDFDEEHLWLAFELLPGALPGQSVLSVDHQTLGFYNHVHWEGVWWSSLGAMTSLPALEQGIRAELSTLPTPFSIEHHTLDPLFHTETLADARADFLGSACEAHRVWLRDWRQSVQVLLDQDSLDTALPPVGHAGQRLRL